MLRTLRCKRQLLSIWAALCLLPTSGQAQTPENDNSLAPHYFPTSEFRDLQSFNADVPDAWAQYLADFREVPIADDDNADIVIRLTAAPAFPEGVMVRITQDHKGNIVGVAKRFTHGTTKPIVYPIAITEKNLADIKRAILSEGFWRLGNRQTVINTDGQSLLLEVKKRGKYHVVYTDDAGEGPLSLIGRAILDVARPMLPPN